MEETNEIQASVENNETQTPSESIEVVPVKKKAPAKKTTNANKILITKWATSQITQWIKKFKKIIEHAKDKWFNESDTSNIIYDFLWETLGYDKYSEITTEYKIKWQYCDYWIILNWKLAMLIEVKQIWIELNDNHLFQAASYAGNEWVKWVILTNLRRRQLYCLSFGDKIEKELVLDVDILNENKTLVPKLQYFHRESLQKNYLDKLFVKKMALSEKNFKKVIFSETIIRKIQTELKTLTWVKISQDEVTNILKKYIQ